VEVVVDPEIVGDLVNLLVTSEQPFVVVVEVRIPEIEVGIEMVVD
jgi:hypothetical protein